MTMLLRTVAGVSVSGSGGHDREGVYLGLIDCLKDNISMAVLAPRSSIAIHSKVWYPSPISLNASQQNRTEQTHRRLVYYRRSRIFEPCSRVTAQVRTAR
jgi:hypothetical protein